MPKALNVGVFLSGYVDASGLPLTEGTVTFYDTDWSTLKTIWLDDNQVDEAPNPFTLRDNGTGIVFASGTYNLLIKDSTGATVDSVPGVQFTPFDPTSDINFIDASTFGPKNDATIQLAIDSAMGEDFRIYLSRGNWTINNNLTIPSNIEIDFEYGAYMTVAIGITLNINGVVPEATLYPFFQGLGTINYDARNNFIPTVWKPGGVYGNTDLTGVWSLAGQFNPDNLRIDGNTISSTNSDGDIVLDPNGTGAVVVSSDLELTGNLVLTGTINITGQLNIDNLRMDGNTLSSTNTDGNVNIVPNGTGSLLVVGTQTVAGQFNADNLRLDGNTLSSTDSNGNVNVIPNGAGIFVVTGTETITGQLNADNLRLDGNTLSSTNTDGNIILDPNGTGAVTVSGPLDLTGIGTVTGQLNVDNLRLDGNTISSTNTGGDINITSIVDGDINFVVSGSGTVNFPSGQSFGNLSLSGNTISSTNMNGDITLDPNGSGTVFMSSDLVVLGTLILNDGGASLHFNPTSGDIGPIVPDQPLSLAVSGTANLTVAAQGSGNLILSAGGVGDVNIGGTDINLTVTGGVNLTGGSLSIETVGSGLKIKEGSNATMGRAVLSGGSVTVSTNKVTANSEIFLSSQITGGTPGFVRITAIVPGTSFNIDSSQIADTSTIAWMIIEPA